MSGGSHLDALDSKVQNLVGCRADEGEVDPRQTGEDQLLGNLVDQRDTETFLQVHQNLTTVDENIEADCGSWWCCAMCHG